MRVKRTLCALLTAATLVGCETDAGDKEIGVVTSGGYCPSLGRGMGMGLVPLQYAEVGTPLGIDARGALLESKVVERPFYKHGSVKR